MIIEKGIHSVVARIVAGDEAGAAEEFVETLALGPGAWAQLPGETQRTFIENAQTFADESADPEQLAIDLDALRSFGKPVLLTLGDQSPPTYAPVVHRLASILPRAETLTFSGAGHIPQVTHPDPYVEVVGSFVQKNEG
jgi:pimeloyl-ACP methyl ester carboxylesterase